MSISGSRVIRVGSVYENGREYYRLHGDRLSNLPDKAIERPAPDYLGWHNETLFRG